MKTKTRTHSYALKCLNVTVAYSVTRCAYLPVFANLVTKPRFLNECNLLNLQVFMKYCFLVNFVQFLRLLLMNFLLTLCVKHCTRKAKGFIWQICEQNFLAHFSRIQKLFQVSHLPGLKRGIVNIVHSVLLEPYHNFSKYNPIFRKIPKDHQLFLLFWIS